jgi:multidrug efflux system membrane fusion protein
VQRGPQGTYAYLIKPDKTVEMRPIKVAQTEGNLALVDEGLNPGEQVVVDGQYKLQPGAHVELTKPQPLQPRRRPQLGQPTHKTASSGKP